MSKKKLSVTTDSRTYKIIVLQELYPPYYDEGWNYHKAKGWTTKRKKVQILHHKYREYRTWKYNRKLQYKI